VEVSIGAAGLQERLRLRDKGNLRGAEYKHDSLVTPAPLLVMQIRKIFKKSHTG
jgi:hypothetical protein